MKRIRYTEQFTTATGQPFLIPNPDSTVQRAARAKAAEAGETRYVIPELEATFATAIVWFANGIPWAFTMKETPQGLQQIPKWTPTIEDNGRAYGCIKAFQHHPDGYVELEESDYKWLLEKVNSEDGATAFRVTQAVVTELLEDVVKEVKKEDS